MSPKETNSPWRFSGKRDEKSGLIRDSISMAIEMRTDFHMDFFLDNRVVFQMKGACTNLGPDSMKVYLRGEVTRAPVPGMKVHVYFSLRVDRKTMPCDFNAEIINMEREGADQFLRLTIPDEMGHNQRRFNVRIPVSKSEIRNFRMWYGKPSAAPDGARSSQVEWLPVLDEHFDIIDISAGGMHVGMTSASPILPFLSKNELILSTGEFEVKGKPVSTLSMVGMIIRIERDERLPWTRIGVNFRRWAVVRQGTLNWLPLTQQEGISPLGSWVFQTMLTRYKIEREGVALYG